MSYSFSLDVTEGTEHAAIIDAVSSKGIAVIETLSDPTRPEMDEHVYAAASAVAGIIGAGCFGRGRTVNVYISGHAEPDHEKRDGWSQDAMTITLSQVQP